MVWSKHSPWPDLIMQPAVLWGKPSVWDVSVSVLAAERQNQDQAWPGRGGNSIATWPVWDNFLDFTFYFCCIYRQLSIGWTEDHCALVEGRRHWGFSMVTGPWLQLEEATCGSGGPCLGDLQLVNRSFPHNYIFIVISFKCWAACDKVGAISHFASATSTALFAICQLGTLQCDWTKNHTVTFCPCTAHPKLLVKTKQPLWWPLALLGLIFTTSKRKHAQKQSVSKEWQWAYLRLWKSCFSRHIIKVDWCIIQETMLPSFCSFRLTVLLALARMGCQCLLPGGEIQDQPWPGGRSNSIAAEYASKLSWMITWALLSHSLVLWRKGRLLCGTEVTAWAGTRRWQWVTCA